MSAAVYANLGSIHGQKGNKQAALDYLNQGLKLEPGKYELCILPVLKSMKIWVKKIWHLKT